MVKFAANQTEDLKMYKLPEGVDYAYKAGVPGLYNEKGELVKKAEDMSAQELSTYEADYRRRRGEAQIKADQQINAILKAEQEARRKAAAPAPDPDPKPAAPAPDPKPKPAPAAPAPDPDPKPAAPAPDPKPKPAPAAPAAPAKPLTPNQEYQKLRKPDPEAAKKLGMEIWAKKYAKTLAPEVVRRQERATMLGRGNTQSGYPVIKKYVQPSVEKAKVEAYDVVLDYLLSEGHADTVEEAHYVMMQLDAEYVQSIVEN